MSSSSRQIVLLFAILLATPSLADRSTWMRVARVCAAVDPVKVLLAIIGNFLGADAMNWPVVNAVPQASALSIQRGLMCPAATSSSAYWHQCWAGAGPSGVTSACATVGWVVVAAVIILVVIAGVQSFADHKRGGGESKPGETYTAVETQNEMAEIRIKITEMETKNNAIHNEIREGFRQLQPTKEHPAA